MTPMNTQLKTLKLPDRFCGGLLVLVLALGCLIALSVQAQSNYPLPYNFSTFAGNAYGGNGTGNQAIFNNPYATAVDSAGNVYVADTTNYAVRKITSTGVVTTLAGLAGTAGIIDGTGSDARFGVLNGIAVDRTGNVYVTDGSYHTVRKITPAGVVTTLDCGRKAAKKIAVLGLSKAMTKPSRNTLRAP